MFSVNFRITMHETELLYIAYEQKGEKVQDKIRGDKREFLNKIPTFC